MFDRAWFDNEIAGLESQLTDAVATAHRIEGALVALRQMRAQMGAEQPAAPGNGNLTEAIDFDQLEQLLPEGHKVDRERGVAPHEDTIHP